MGIFGMEPAVTEIGTVSGSDHGYCSGADVLMLGGGVLRGAGDSRTPMNVTAIAKWINVVLTYGLIFGRSGCQNSAWWAAPGGLSSRGSWGLAVLLGPLAGQKRRVRSRADGWRPEFPTARNLLRIGIPAAVEQILISLAFLVMMTVVARLGTHRNVSCPSDRVQCTVALLLARPGLCIGRHRACGAERWRQREDEGQPPRGLPLPGP